MNQLFRGFAPLFVFAAAASAQATIVYSNNAAGDAFSNAGTTNQGQAVGSSGWFYNNVRRSGTSGITNTYPRNGNGSARLQGANDGSKADIEFLSGGTLFGGNAFATSSLGSLASFTGASYEWFRSSSSTARTNLHPSFRVLLDADGNLGTTNDRGSLIFESIYNGGTVTNDLWTTETITSATKLWNVGLGLGNEFTVPGTGGAYNGTLADWTGYLTSAVVLGFSMGIGSGWGGTFDGAVDNVSYTFGSVTSTTNFEVAAEPVPEPMTLALGAAGLAAAIRRRRARR